MKRILALFLAALLLAAPALAETMFDGSVISRGSVSVTAPYGGTVESFSIRAGDRIDIGDTVAILGTTKVYATVSGTVTGIFAQAGDGVEDIIARYGAVLYIAPESKYSIAADIEKAYNSSATKYVNIGETVYIACVSDGTRKAVGKIVAAQDTTYTVETNSGELLMEETVNIYRSQSYTSATRIGRGTVSRTAEIASGGSGSILAMHVQDGDAVARGQLLYETVSGTLDGLFVAGDEVVSTASGIVAATDIVAGAKVDKGSALLTVYPEDMLEIEISIDEYDLTAISEGDDVLITFHWDEDSKREIPGTVSMISYVSSTEQEGGDATYKGYIDFVPDDTVRLGMTVMVRIADVEDAGEDKIAADEIPDEGDAETAVP